MPSGSFTLQLRSSGQVRSVECKALNAAGEGRPRLKSGLSALRDATFAAEWKYLGRVRNGHFSQTLTFHCPTHRFLSYRSPMPDFHPVQHPGSSAEPVRFVCSISRHVVTFVTFAAGC